MHECENKLRTNDSKSLEDSCLYRQIIGNLIYLITCTRPDVCYSVSMLSQFLEYTTKAHLEVGKACPYISQGNKISKSSFQKSTGLKLQGFSVSDWGNLETRTSVSSYCFIMNTNNNMVCWKSRKQACVALSICEAEYVALVSHVQEAKFLRCLYEDLSGDKVDTVDIFVDNQSAIAVAKILCSTKEQNT